MQDNLDRLFAKFKRDMLAKQQREKHIHFDELGVIGRRMYHTATGAALADFSSHTAAVQAAHVLNDHDWAPPFGRWFTTQDDAQRIHAVRKMIKELNASLKENQNEHARN